MVFDNSEHTNLATTFQGSECTRVKLVTPEIREAAEFYAASMEIDHLLSENRTKAATRKLRALMKVVLENISDRTSEYISQIRKRWAPLIEIDACLKARRSKSATFQERIELVRIEFHDNPAALEFIDEFESATMAIDSQTSSLGLTCKIRTLIRTIVETREARLGNRLLPLAFSHYQGTMNFEHYLRRLYEARKATDCKAKANG